jgi:o-succinylbenzoate synthase
MAFHLKFITHMKASYQKYILNFKRPSGTSRGVMTEKETWFIILENKGKKGIGECGILRSLSIDDRPDYEEKLKWVCENIHLGEDKLWEDLIEFPSIQFGLETAFKSLEGEMPYMLFPSNFTNGEANIDINGLVWMGGKAYMKEQIEDKLQRGFKCIKLKIGAIDFNYELELLQFIRLNFSPLEIEIRVDANGAFTIDEALSKLAQLSEFQLHSIEQPIKKGQADSMSWLCLNSSLPIALDEELIGVFTIVDKEALLKKIQPQYIILKPSLVGGFRGCKEWIAIAEKYNIGWWVTSALESNIGLNAIAQWTFLKNNPMPQGLGTGALYTNNFESPLEVNSGKLHYNSNINWQVNL